MNTILRIEDNYEFEDYIFRLEKEYFHSLKKFNDKELVDIFPESKNIIPSNIKFFENKRKEIIGSVLKRMTSIKEKNIDDFSLWFFKEWIKETKINDLIEVEKKIIRLKGVLLMMSGRVPKEWLTQEEIQQALAFPIEILVDKQFKRSSRGLVGLCPFHDEKTPSFFVYPETNSCWCFGCQKGGNVINLTRELYGYSFKEAVKFLIQKK